MAKADSVHSTPPTNTSARHSRRSILGAIAGSAAAAGSIAGAEGINLSANKINVLAPKTPSKEITPSQGIEADPIFAVIERHKDLAKTYDAVGEGRAHCKDFGTLTEAEQDRVRKLNDTTDEAHLPLEAAAMDLFNTHPTTRTGIITALFYMRIQHRNDGEHMIKGWLEDEDGGRYIDWRDAWLETLTQAVLHLDDAAKARETRRDRDA
jgi:hypothetical protein